jgi:hypothetical protein
MVDLDGRVRESGELVRFSQLKSAKAKVDQERAAGVPGSRRWIEPLWQPRLKASRLPPRRLFLFLSLKLAEAEISAKLAPLKQSACQDWLQRA